LSIKNSLSIKQASEAGELVYDERRHLWTDSPIYPAISRAKEKTMAQMAAQNGALFRAAAGGPSIAQPAFDDKVSRAHFS